MPMVELVGAYEGIKFAVKELQATKLWVEGHSAVVMKWLSVFQGPGHRVNALLIDIKCWMASLDSWRVSHVYREANSPACWVAREGKENGDWCYHEDSRKKKKCLQNCMLC